MKLVFYISGHGYGHAVRDIEIVKSLLKINPQAEIHVRTKAPKWLFEPLLNERVLYHERELDFGVLQKNSFSADKKATFTRYAEFINQKEKLVDKDIKFLKSIQPDIILSDITPFAFDAAEAFGKKAVATGNFSWDWIYSAYLDEHPDYEWIVNDIKSSYAKAERLWRIPFYGDMTAFPNRINVPLIGRKATMPAAEVRERLGIPKDSSNKFVLLGLRKADFTGVNWDNVEAIKDITFVAVSRDITLKNCIHVQEGTIPFEDIVNACDAVLSKPGYSMVSEVITNQTPIVYVPRNNFVEDPALIKGLEEFAVCQELSQKEYFAGHWQPVFDLLFENQNEWKNIQKNGADVIAAMINEYV